MNTRKRYEKVLQLVQSSGIKGSCRSGVRIDDLTERLKEELQKPKLAINTIENLIKKVQTASGGVLTEEINKILRDNFFSKSANHTRTPSKGDFWSSNILMRPFRK